MSGLEFTRSVIEALAWPLTVLVGILLLRAPLARALESPLKRWKAGPAGVEVEYWEQALETARSELEQSPDVDSATASPVEGIGVRQELAQLAQVSPRTSVMEALDRVEARLRNLLDGVVADAERLGPDALALLAHRHGRISEQTLRAIKGLTVLRNLAAHGETKDIDVRRALEYLVLTDAVLFALGSDQ